MKRSALPAWFYLEALPWPILMFSLSNISMHIENTTANTHVYSENTDQGNEC